jgi:putative ABC transport system permease protein
MDWLRVFASRLLAVFRKRRLDQELDEELRAHVEMLIEANTRKGMSLAEARREAHRSFGGMEQTRESYRDQRGLPALETWLRDFRFGLRMLRRDSGFTAVAMLTLGLGIGAATCIFSVVNGVLLRPLPFRDPGRLVAVWENNARENDPHYPLAPANYFDLTRESRSFEKIDNYFSFSAEYILSNDQLADRVRGSVISPGLFQVFGVNAAVGRTFLDEEGQPARSGVVLLSDGFWRRHFGGNADVLGQTLTIDGRARSVVGVLPPQFQFPSKETEVWIPLTFAGTYFPQNQITTRSIHFLGAIGRLRPGVRLQQARAELEGIARRLEQAYPESNQGIGVTVLPLLDEIVGKVRPALLALMAGVGFVLLIACANVANVTLARSAAREREIAVRAAIGAGRPRIIRQLLTESALIAVLGGAIGLLVAYWGVHLFVTFGPAGIPRLDKVGLNKTVLVFALVVTALTAMVFGLVPARRLSRLDLVSSLQGSGRAMAGDPGQSGLRRWLVIIEMSLSLVLLAGAGLMIRSFSRLTAIDPGFNPKNLLTFQIMLPGSAYGQMQERMIFHQKLFDALKSLPGAKYVGYTTRLPLAPNRATTNVTTQLIIEGQPTAGGQKPEVDFRRANFEYFRAMGIPVLKGREFNERDTADATPVALINDGTAQLFTTNPVGKRIQLSPIPTWYTVIGVVGSIRHMGLETTPRPEVYVHTLQNPPTSPFVVIRTSGNPEPLVSFVRDAIQKLDRRVPVFNIATMEELLAGSLEQRRFNMLLMGLFAAAALSLAAVGIYGVVAYSVSLRTHEIGIRVALGAGQPNVVGLVAREVARIALIGFGIGLVAALALSHMLSALLFGIQPSDPATYAGVGALQFVVALLAAYVPIRRALRVDPMTALRHE